MDTVLSAPKHLKVDFHFRTEVSVFPSAYKGRTNRKAALMAHFDALAHWLIGKFPEWDDIPF